MSLTREEIQDLFLAGKIAHLTLKQIERHIKPGITIGALYDSIVRVITQRKGVDLAFPPNISIDECAAHDTAAPDPIEKRIISKKALIKIDIGANVNGMLSDTAKTFSLDGKHSRLIKSAEEALNNAIAIIKPGISVNEIGSVIQETIESQGFKSIANLTGHQLKKGNLHAGLSIPNVKSSMFSLRSKIKKGMILAIEPFSTLGSSGHVAEGSSPALIYSSKGNPKTEIGKIIVDRYRKVPFSLRSAMVFLKEKHNLTVDLAEILKRDNFHGYHPLIERSRGLVAQAEHTILVTAKGAKIIT